MNSQLHSAIALYWTWKHDMDRTWDRKAAEYLGHD